MIPDEEIMFQIERRSQRQLARTRAMLMEAGRSDLVSDLDTNLRDIRLGLTGARSAWHSISKAQRSVLEVMVSGRWLVRSPASRTRYDAHGEPFAVSNVCGIATIRNLTARDLLACDGTAFDPEARLVLTERGRFVLTHGRPAA